MAHRAVRVGVIGTTAYAETHLTRLAQHEDVRLVAVAGRDGARAQAIADKYEIPRVHLGYDALIDSGEIDALVIIAPDDLHETIAVKALAAGIHVLCEKPLAGDPAQARRMVDAARASGLVNMSYFALRTTPSHRHLAQLVADGVIGTVRSGSFTLDHGMFRGPAYNWRFDAARGGGVVADLGCYLFDLARLYIGDVASVTAAGTSSVDRPAPDGAPYRPADDSSVGALTFTSGAHATFAMSVVATIGPGFQRNVVELQGETGRLELRHNFASSELRLIRDGSTEPEILATPASLLAPSGDAEFIDAIVHGTEIRPDFFDGWQVQKVVDAALHSSAETRWVSIQNDEERAAE